MNRLKWVAAIVLAAGMGEGRAADYTIAPVPFWVSVAPEPDPGATSVAAGPDGEAYLLLDRQVRVASPSTLYRRAIVRLDNQAAVSEESQLRLDYDPSREHLSLHHATLWRGRARIDALAQARIEILRREPALDDHLIDGVRTLHLIFNDVRVGDVLDYAYSREGDEPEWSGRFQGDYTMRWGSPVGYQRLRLLVPRAAPLHVRSQGVPGPRERAWQEQRVLEWVERDVSPVHEEDDAPQGVQQLGSVEVSQFRDWQAVADAARRLFDDRTPPSRELAALIARLGAAAKTPAERVVAVMRFVQDEVRYTGIEIGSGAWRPRTPNVVLQRRYGDCKDKTVLAVALLRGLGIDAAPALVSTGWREALPTHLPAPALFDHAIVRVRIDGVSYWLDATRSAQGGSLGSWTQARYGAALVLAPGTRAPESIPAAPADSVLTQESAVFDLRAGILQPATLEVRTSYHDAEADRMRRKLQHQTLEELGRDYLNFYVKNWSGTRSAGPLRVTDDREANVLTIVESYRIDRPFQSRSGGGLSFTTRAELIDDALEAPQTVNRRTPLAIEFPRTIEERVIVHLPEAWNIPTGPVEVRGPGLEYRSDVAYANDTITMEYRYRALTDRVSLEQLHEHLAQRAKARDDTSFELSHPVLAFKQKPVALRGNDMAGRIFFGIAGMLVLLNALGYVLAMRTYLMLAVRRVEAQPCDEASVLDDERALLGNRDATLTALGFAPLGYYRCTPLLTYYSQPEHVRVLVHAGEPIIAEVVRRRTPELGATEALRYRTVLGDGRQIVTTLLRADPELPLPLIEAEACPEATTEQLLARHHERIRAAGATPQRVDDLVAVSAAAAALYQAWREELHIRGWTQPTRDRNTDRITLKGALGLARLTRKLYGRRGMALIKAGADTPENRAARARADAIAVRSIARTPARAPGTPSGLWGLILGSAAVSLGVLAVVMNVPTALMILAVLALHEAGHAVAMHLLGHRSVHVLFIPVLGALTLAAGATRSVLGRIAILLAGPAPGLVLSLVLVACLGPLKAGYWREFAVLLTAINALNLLPFVPLDGGRVFESLTAPGSRVRIAVQILGVAGIAGLAWILRSSVFGAFALLWVWVMRRQATAWRLYRAVMPRISDPLDREAVVRAATESLTEPAYTAWRAPTRIAQVRAMVEQLALPRPTARDRWIGVLAYVGCVGVVFAVAWAFRG